MGSELWNSKDEVGVGQILMRGEVGTIEHIDVVGALKEANEPCLTTEELCERIQSEPVALTPILRELADRDVIGTKVCGDSMVVWLRD